MAKRPHHPPGSSPFEKNYVFVPDPTHVETLSGRVRTACLTCRRLKSKCSGNFPCDTCEAKGYICQVAERKSSKGSASGAVRSHASRGSTSPKERPTMPSSDSSYSNPGAINPTAARDGSIYDNYFGYSSSDVLYPQNSPTFPSAARQSISSLSTPLSDLSPMNELSASTSYPLGWNNNFQGFDSGSWPTLAQLETPDQNLANPVPISSAMMGSTTMTSASGASAGYDQAVSTSLLAAAESLEEQALALRRLAAQQDPDFP